MQLASMNVVDWVYKSTIFLNIPWFALFKAYWLKHLFRVEEITEVDTLYFSKWTYGDDNANIRFAQQRSCILEYHNSYNELIMILN